jgi:hypothetical protein
MAGVNIVDFGKAAQQYGWVVGENPAFGTGRVGQHAKGSHHYYGEAVDITAPTNVDVAPAYPGGKPIPWQQRTGELSWRLKQLGGLTELLGPGDPGHATHVHAALTGTANFTPQQLEWAFTGRTKDASGKLTDVMPGAQATEQAQSQSPVTSAATGNVYNFYLGGKKQDGDTTDFLSSYVNQLMDGSSKKVQSQLNPTAMLASAFNTAPMYE